MALLDRNGKRNITNCGTKHNKLPFTVVYRVRNKEVERSTFDVAGMIVDRYYQIMEVESEGGG